jgi:GDP-L-fucose synthase
VADACPVAKVNLIYMPMDLKNKKILVTGGHGFVGKHLINFLMERRGLAEKNIYGPNSQELDLRIAANAEKAVKGINIVFHLAALSGGIGFSVAHPGQMYFDNVMMGFNLIEASRKAGVEKFINIGSYNEYPKSAPMPLEEADLWSGLPDQAFLPYGLAKKSLLILMQSYRQEYVFNGIHLIMASMYGPGYKEDNTTLIPSLIRQINNAKKESLPLIGWGTGKATRDFLFVEDAAEGIILAAEKYDKPKPINLGSGQETPIKEVFETLCQIMGFPGEIKWDLTKPEGQLRYIMDSTKAKAEFGFEPKTTLIEGLKKTINIG